MLAPSGDQFEITGAGHRAVVTESGGALRLLERAGVPLVDGFAEDEMSAGGRGQLLVPWPNRVRDGRYAFGGEERQLPLTEPSRRHASHGLARWAAWQVVEHAADVVRLRLRVVAQTGYPWTLDLGVRYRLAADGLEVTQTAHNRSAEPAPYACGAHPYLAVDGGPVDDWLLHVPAASRTVVDDRKIPVRTERVAGTDLDFRTPRRVGDVVLDHTFTDLARDGDGRSTVTVRHGGRAVSLWGDRRVRWFQLYTADDRPATARRSLAVEPMTAPPDAFRTGQDLVVLDPDERVAVRWGIRCEDDPAMLNGRAAT